MWMVGWILENKTNCEERLVNPHLRNMLCILLNKPSSIWTTMPQYVYSISLSSSNIVVVGVLVFGAPFHGCHKQERVACRWIQNTKIIFICWMKTAVKRKQLCIARGRIYSIADTHSLHVSNALPPVLVRFYPCVFIFYFVHCMCIWVCNLAINRLKMIPIAYSIFD